MVDVRVTLTLKTSELLNPMPVGDSTDNSDTNRSSRPTATDGGRRLKVRVQLLTFILIKTKDICNYASRLSLQILQTDRLHVRMQ